MIQEARRKRTRPLLKKVPLVFVSYFLIVLLIAWYFENQATSTLIVVRHAEQTDPSAEDPPLSQAGQLRAYQLAEMLSDVDVVAGVDAIYVTPLRRSEETARPLANMLGLPLNHYQPLELEQLEKTIKEHHKGQIVLVVGHSNTVPAIVAQFSGSKKIQPFAEDQYHDMFILSMPWFGKVKTLALKYGRISLPDGGPPSVEQGDQEAGEKD